MRIISVAGFCVCFWMNVWLVDSTTTDVFLNAVEDTKLLENPTTWGQGNVFGVGQLTFLCLPDDQLAAAKKMKLITVDNNGSKHSIWAIVHGHQLVGANAAGRRFSLSAYEVTTPSEHYTLSIRKLEESGRVSHYPLVSMRVACDEKTFTGGIDIGNTGCKVYSGSLNKFQKNERDPNLIEYTETIEGKYRMTVTLIAVKEVEYKSEFVNHASDDDLTPGQILQNAKEEGEDLVSEMPGAVGVGKLYFDSSSLGGHVVAKKMKIVTLDAMEPKYNIWAVLWGKQFDRAIKLFSFHVYKMSYPSEHYMLRIFVKLDNSRVSQVVKLEVACGNDIERSFGHGKDIGNSGCKVFPGNREEFQTSEAIPNLIQYTSSDDQHKYTLSLSLLAEEVVDETNAKVPSGDIIVGGDNGYNSKGLTANFPANDGTPLNFFRSAAIERGQLEDLVLETETMFGVGQFTLTPNDPKKMKFLTLEKGGAKYTLWVVAEGSLSSDHFDRLDLTVYRTPEVFHDQYLVTIWKKKKGESDVPVITISVDCGRSPDYFGKRSINIGHTGCKIFFDYSENFEPNPLNPNVIEYTVAKENDYSFRLNVVAEKVREGDISNEVPQNQEQHDEDDLFGPGVNPSGGVLEEVQEGATGTVDELFDDGEEKNSDDQDSQKSKPNAALAEFTEHLVKYMPSGTQLPEASVISIVSNIVLDPTQPATSSIAGQVSTFLSQYVSQVWNYLETCVTTGQPVGCNIADELEYIQSSQYLIIGSGMGGLESPNALSKIQSYFQSRVKHSFLDWQNFDKKFDGNVLAKMNAVEKFLNNKLVKGYMQLNDVTKYIEKVELAIAYLLTDEEVSGIVEALESPKLDRSKFNELLATNNLKKKIYWNDYIRQYIINDHRFLTKNARRAVKLVDRMSPSDMAKVLGNPNWIQTLSAGTYEEVREFLMKTCGVEEKFISDNTVVDTKGTWSVRELSSTKQKVSASAGHTTAAGGQSSRVSGIPPKKGSAGNVGITDTEPLSVPSKEKGTGGILLGGVNRAVPPIPKTRKKVAFAQPREETDTSPGSRPSVNSQSTKTIIPPQPLKHSSRTFPVNPPPPKTSANTKASVQGDSSDVKANSGGASASAPELNRVTNLVESTSSGGNTPPSVAGNPIDKSASGNSQEEMRKAGLARFQDLASKVVLPGTKPSVSAEERQTPVTNSQLDGELTHVTMARGTQEKKRPGKANRARWAKLAEEERERVEGITNINSGPMDGDKAPPPGGSENLRPHPTDVATQMILHNAGTEDELENLKQDHKDDNPTNNNQEKDPLAIELLGSDLGDNDPNDHQGIGKNDAIPPPVAVDVAANQPKPPVPPTAGDQVHEFFDDFINRT